MEKAKKLPSGNWRVRVCIGKKDGKRVWRSFTGPSKREIEAQAAEYALNLPGTSGRDDMTLKRAMLAYIEAKRNVLSPSTIPGYQSIIRNHLQGINQIPLYKLTADRIQAEINREAAAVSPKTVENIYSLLTATLKMYAPLKRFDITLPQQEVREPRIPSREEIETVYAAVRGGPMEVPFLLAAACGMRRSEIASIRLADVGDGKIRVSKATVADEHRELVEKKPKTDAGTRTVYCSPKLTDLIRERGADPVCELTPAQISDRWRRLLKRLHLEPCRFHDLRHYYASEGLRMGVPTRYVADMMGHSSSYTTERVYQHIFADARREEGMALAERAGALLNNAGDARRLESRREAELIDQTGALLNGRH